MSSNYYAMNEGGGKMPVSASSATSSSLHVPGLDDPSLSQEEKDLRLALALQQQENAIVYDQHKKRHDAVVSSQLNRTTRSNAGTRLAAVRKSQKEGDGLVAPVSYGSYVGPDGSSDAILAGELQKVEDATASTAKIIAQDNEAAKAANRRSGRSVF